MVQTTVNSQFASNFDFIFFACGTFAVLPVQGTWHPILLPESCFDS